MIILTCLVAIVTLVGMAQGAAGLLAVLRFSRRLRVGAVRSGVVPVTVLKPLFGAEPLLEEALATLCAQKYGPLQIVFGVQDPQDPAIAVVDRLSARFPDRDIALVVDPTTHGRNRKVGNLMNMLPAARHDVLVIADSDVHAAPDYLDRIVTALERPGVGVVTTLYSGMPASQSLAARLGATAISHGFLPGALLGRALGRQDCLGATMALRRDTLEALGGLAALVPHLADDHVLGALARARGMGVALAATVPATTVPETRLGDLFRHELRWGRTIAALVPLQFALSVVQYSLVWAALSVGLSGGAPWAWGLLMAAWACRAGIHRAVDHALGLRRSTGARVVPLWLLPLRDLMSVAVVVASYASDHVEWRGQMLRAEALRESVLRPAALTIPLGTERS